MVTELRDIKNGTKINHRFRPTESMEAVELEAVNAAYIGPSEADENILQFKNADTFETIDVPITVFGDKAGYLTEGFEVKLEIWEEQNEVLSFKWKDNHPTTVFEVTETSAKDESGTADAGRKLATLENGKQIKVPMFVKIGDRVRVNMDKDSYVGKED